jgi:hypothetical protein
LFAVDKYFDYLHSIVTDIITDDYLKNREKRQRYNEKVFAEIGDCSKCKNNDNDVTK